jgi:hypothetical protein
MNTCSQIIFLLLTPEKINKKSLASLWQSGRGDARCVKNTINASSGRSRFEIRLSQKYSVCIYGIFIHFSSIIITTICYSFFSRFFKASLFHGEEETFLAASCTSNERKKNEKLLMLVFCEKVSFRKASERKSLRGRLIIRA